MQKSFQLIIDKFKKKTTSQHYFHYFVEVMTFSSNTYIINHNHNMKLKKILHIFSILLTHIINGKLLETCDNKITREKQLH